MRTLGNKLFGSALFSFRRKVEPGQMYDFAQHGLLNPTTEMGNILSRAIPADEVSEAYENLPRKTKQNRKEVLNLTPKALYELKSLNDNNFSILTDNKYLNEQIATLKEKLSLLPAKKKIKISRNLFWGSGEANRGGSIEYARQELESMIERLENRRHLTGEKQNSFILDMVEKYPHTTASLLSDVLDKNRHLSCRKAESFVPDFPKNAIRAMKEYDEMCVEVCNKKTHFYVVAKHEDFERVNGRRDPILLAQSPFGFFWQILGAWDEEMIYLGDL